MDAADVLALAALVLIPAGIALELGLGWALLALGILLLLAARGSALMRRKPEEPTDG